MAAFNSVTMVGNVTRDPQLSYTPNQTAVVDFGLAVNRKFKKSDGSAAEDVCFIDCRGFGKLAENVNKFVHKGSLLLVDGALALDRWEKEGVTHSKHRIVVTAVQFLPDGKGGKDRDAGQDDPNQPEPVGDNNPL